MSGTETVAQQGDRSAFAVSMVLIASMAGVRVVSPTLSSSTTWWAPSRVERSKTV